MRRRERRVASLLDRSTAIAKTAGSTWETWAWYFPPPSHKCAAHLSLLFAKADHNV
jgi:hypothetical protein